MKKWLKNLLGDLLDFVVSKIVPVAIALAVLSLLIFLKDYDARIDKWCNGDWDRYGLIFFAVIPSVILLLNLLVDDWDEMPAWLWLGCYASVGLTALFIDPKAPIASALSVYATLFFVLYSAFFLIFVGLNKFFSYKVINMAKWGLAIASGVLLVVPTIVSFILANDGKLVPHTFEINEMPIVEISALVMFGCGMLFSKVIDSSSSSRSSSSRSSGRAKPSYNQVYNAASSAARDSYFTLVGVSGGNGGYFTITLKYNHSDRNSRQAYLQRFQNILANLLSGYDVSGISISAQ